MKKEEIRRTVFTITSNDDKIFTSLSNAGRPLAIKQLAKRTLLSWPTVRSHVEKLVNLGLFKIDKTIRKNRVSINPKWIIKMRQDNFITEERFQILKEIWID